MIDERTFDEISFGFQNLMHNWSHRTTAFAIMATQQVALTADALVATAMTGSATTNSARARYYGGDAAANMTRPLEYSPNAEGTLFDVSGGQPWHNHSGQMTGAGRVYTSWDSSSSSVYAVRTASITAFYEDFISDHHYDHGKSYVKWVKDKYGNLTGYLDDVADYIDNLPSTVEVYKKIKAKYEKQYKVYDNKNKMSGHRRRAVALFNKVSLGGMLSGPDATLFTGYGL